MRAPLSWLREYVEFELSPEQLAERLTQLGFELQGISRIGSDWSSIVVGELLEVRPHPNARSLSLTRVRVGDNGSPLDIVCGATNIAAGQRVPVALPGALLPGGRQIGVSRIQGEESQGMLCSGDELGLTADADGILILDGVGRVGQPLEEIVGDVVLDLDVKPNRGDALSLIGLAREVAGISGTRLRWPNIDVPESGDQTSEHLAVEIEDERLCSRFVGRYVDGLSLGESPLHIQLRLSAAGLRPVSNVVDASNYVMLELGKPIHTFDAAAVDEGRIIVRPARAGERLETLDHVERELTGETLIIADPQGPIGIAGVMGGAASEVGQSTQAVIIESAVFDPVSIRRTAQRYALRSEASARFEKGQESRLALLGANRTAQLIADWAGGRPAVGVVDTNPADEAPRPVVFRPARVSRLLGADIEADRMRELLSQVEIDSRPAQPGDGLRLAEHDDQRELVEAELDGALVAIVPPHRRDLLIEADVSEEVARLLGYEELPARLPDSQMPGYRIEPRRFADRLRDLLSGRGLSEVLTNGLIAPNDHLRLGIPAGDTATVTVANPVSPEHSELRRSLLPGLVRVLVANERQRRHDLAIFELGAVHRLDGGVPSEAGQLGLLLAGNWLEQSWAQPARVAGVEDAKGLIEWLADRVGLHGVEYDTPSPPPLAAVEHPGRTASVLAGQPDGTVVLGRVGELDPRYLTASGSRTEQVAFALLDLSVLVEAANSTPLVGQLAKLPVVERDLAVVVSRETPQVELARIISAAAGELLLRLSLFDRYQGPPLENDEISLAYRLQFQPQEVQLADAQLDEIMQNIGQALGAVGARIRGG